MSDELPKINVLAFLCRGPVTGTTLLNVESVHIEDDGSITAAVSLEDWMKRPPPPSRYSALWVEQEVKTFGYTWLDNHTCGACGSMVGYIFTDREVLYRSACGCSWSPDRVSSYKEVAEWFAMQRTDEIRERLVKGFKR